MSHYGIQIKGTSPIIEKKPRPLSSQSPFLSVHAEGGRIGFKEGMGAAKKRKKQPDPRPDKILKQPKPSPHLDEPKSPGRPKGGSRPGPSKGPSPKKKFKVEEDWAAQGGRIGLKEGGDSNWIQKATKNMRTDKPCTGKKFGSKTCPPGSKRYNLAKTFKKMAKNA